MESRLSCLDELHAFLDNLETVVSSICKQQEKTNQDIQDLEHKYKIVSKQNNELTETIDLLENEIESIKKCKFQKQQQGDMAAATCMDD